MPQATEELQQKMEARFGNPISDEGPHEYLVKNGWVCGRDWCWRKPGQSIHTMSREEFECVLFLIQEWDYGTDYPKAEPEAAP